MICMTEEVAAEQCGRVHVMCTRWVKEEVGPEQAGWVHVMCME